MSYTNYPKLSLNTGNPISQEETDQEKTIESVQINYKSNHCNPNKIKVYNISGTLLMETQFEEKLTLDESYKKGAYILIIDFYNSSIVRKVFKLSSTLWILLVPEIIDYSEVNHKGILLFQKMQPEKAVLWLIEGYNMVNLSLIEKIDIGDEVTKETAYLTTTVNAKSNKAIIKIPKNLYHLFSDNWELILHTIAHECVHVIQRLKPPKLYAGDGYHNLREFLAYYWNVFQEDYCMENIPELKEAQKKYFAKKAKDYYNKLNFMDANSFKSKYDKLNKTYP